tara:strand:- start:184 stop:867 length:684 start_codon:yes stop_codon:yes gene_type:complete
VVVDSGIDGKTGKVVGKVGVKLCYINRQKQWREITTEVFTTNTGIAKTIKAQEAAEQFVKTCKHCKAKKFTAKSGNVVCANACWTTWGNKKNATTKKTAQKKPQKIAAKKSQKKAPNIMVGKVERKKRRTSNKTAEKIFTAEILPGDLVTVEEIEGEKVTKNFTGKILGIVKSVKDNAVDVDWTANTSTLEDWALPRWKTVVVPKNSMITDYRFKVLSREVKYTIVT